MFGAKRTRGLRDQASNIRGRIGDVAKVHQEGKNGWTKKKNHFPGGPFTVIDLKDGGERSRKRRPYFETSWKRVEVKFVPLKQRWEVAFEPSLFPGFKKHKTLKEGWQMLVELKVPGSFQRRKGGGIATRLKKRFGKKTKSIMNMIESTGNLNRWEGAFGIQGGGCESGQLEVENATQGTR